MFGKSFLSWNHERDNTLTENNIWLLNIESFIVFQKKLSANYLSLPAVQSIQSTSSLVCADVLLNIHFSFTQARYKGFLLRHNSFSYVIPNIWTSQQQNPSLRTCPP